MGSSQPSTGFPVLSPTKSNVSRAGCRILGGSWTKRSGSVGDNGLVGVNPSPVSGVNTVWSGLRGNVSGGTGDLAISSVCPNASTTVIRSTKNWPARIPSNVDGGSSRWASAISEAGG